MVDSFLFDRILSSWHGRNARSSFTLLQMSLSSGRWRVTRFARYAPKIRLAAMRIPLDDYPVYKKNDHLSAAVYSYEPPRLSYFSRILLAIGRWSDG